jgi:tetratricopeptide (TPR) repeat protein
MDAYLDVALSGHGQVVLITGEAGCGKTALMQAFALRAQAAHPDLVVAGGHGNAHTGAGDPYLPFRELLSLLTGDVEAAWAAGVMSGEEASRLWHLLPLTVQALVKTGPDLIDLFVPGEPLLARARRVSPWPIESVPLSRLQEVVTRGPEPSRALHFQQSALFEQYSQVLRALASSHPLLLTLDDLQWADGGSLNLLFHLGRRLAGSRILILGAYRPADLTLGRPASLPMPGTAERELEEAGERHPLETIVNEFQRTFGDIEVDLERVEGRRFVDDLLDSEANHLGDAFREALHQRTQGHPLFTVELLRGMQERGDLVQDREGRWVEGSALPWETLPARVEAVIAERIGRLPQKLRGLLTVASVEGDIFTAEVVARTGAADERDVVRWLSQTLDRRHYLVSARGMVRAGSQRLSQYCFRHSLYQRYLYSTLDEVERAHLHEQVGVALEGLYGPHDTVAVAVQLARHFEQAGMTEKAIHYLHQAGERAYQLSAYQEGLAHLRRALALLMTLHDSPARAWQELDLVLALGKATIGGGVYTPEAGTILARSRELGQQTGQVAQLCQALGEMSLFHYVRAEHRRAREFAEEALSHAQRTEGPLLVAWCRWLLGFILFALGEFVKARQQLEQVIVFFASEQGPRSSVPLAGGDAGAGALAYAACSLWSLGYPEQAAKHSRQALTRAGEVDHAVSLADALSYGCCLFNAMGRDAPALKRHAEELVQLAHEIVPSWLELGLVFRGKALAIGSLLNLAGATGTAGADLFDLYTAVMLRGISWMFDGGAEGAPPGLQPYPSSLEQEIARLSVTLHSEVPSPGC